MNPWINYHHLYYFKTIVEEQSVTKAAHRLRLGQSTLSTQLKQFEDSLGLKLFERKNKRLLLSEQGKVAYDYAQQIFKIGTEMYEVLHDQVKPSRIHLQIGALDSMPKTLLAQLTVESIKIQPCQVTIVEGSSDQLLRDLQNHKIDLHVTNFVPHGMSARGLNHRCISKKNVGIYGSSRMKYLRKGFPQSLKGHSFVMPTYDSQMRYEIEHWLKAHDIHVDIVAETQDSSLKKILATEGVGLICTSEIVVKQILDDKQLFFIGTMENVYEEIYLLSGQRKIPHPVAAKLMKSFASI